MKTLVSTFALALALAFTGPAFAGDVTTAKTQADCEKAGGVWDAATTSAQRKRCNPASFAMRSNSGGVGFGRRPFCARFGAGRPRGDDCIRGLAGANDLTFRVRHSSAMSSYGT